MVSPPRGSQGKAGISWVRASVSAREPENSPKRPRCLLEVRYKVTPRCGPGLAAGGLWVRQAGARVWVRTGQGARDELPAGPRGCSTLWSPGVHFLLPTSSSCKLQTQSISAFSLPSQASWHGQPFSMTSSKVNSPYLLPMWEIQLSQPPVRERPL